MDECAILHSDMNSFYASVEVMLDPSLKGKAVAVCGSVEERHGIVLAKSDLAKKAGVKTGMVSWQAKQLCPELILVPPQYDEYLKYSKLAHGIYERYTPLREPFGMDECWLDVTSGNAGYSSPRQIAEEIRAATREELGLTVSIGVSFNKIFAKLGSDLKKPDAITEITRENFKEKIWPLAADEMIYCGPQTMKKLVRYGIHTIGDVAALDPEFLRYLLGINGIALWKYANGLDSARVIHKDFVSPIKSVGHGITCVADLEDNSEVAKVMLALSQNVGHRLRIHELAARGVQVYIRGNDLGGAQFQCKLPIATQLPNEIAAAAFQLFRRKYAWGTKVRAVCVRAIDLVSKNDATQLSLLDDPIRRIKKEHLQDAVEEIRGRFGKQSLTYAALVGDLKMPDDGRDKVKMPGMMYQ